EVNDPYELPEIDEAGDGEVSERELKMATQLIESLTEPFEPEKFEDTYRNQVLELVERKAAGEEEVVVTPAPAAEEEVVDRMAALEASVKEAKEARSRHPSAKAKKAEAAKKAETADAAEKPAKKPAAKRRKTA